MDDLPGCNRRGHPYLLIKLFLAESVKRKKKNQLNQTHGDWKGRKYLGNIAAKVFPFLI